MDQLAAHPCISSATASQASNIITASILNGNYSRIVDDDAGYRPLVPDVMAKARDLLTMALSTQTFGLCSIPLRVYPKCAELEVELHSWIQLRYQRGIEEDVCLRCDNYVVVNYVLNVQQSHIKIFTVT
jgi:hypothetical protein